MRRCVWLVAVVASLAAGCGPSVNVEPERTPERLQQRLVKTGGRLVKHARYYWLLRAEGHLTRRLFGATVRCIGPLPVPAG